jgi:hypothetical protein
MSVLLLFALEETTASLGVRSGSESLSNIFLPTKNFSATQRCNQLAEGFIGVRGLIYYCWGEILERE